MLTTACFIPARLQSTRLPIKLLQPLCTKYNVIQTTYINAVATNLFTEVIVIADDITIVNNIESIGGKAILSKNFNTGTDRIAAFAKNTNADCIINLQGDEPFVNKEILEKLIEQLQNTDVQVASLMHKIIDKLQITNPNCVKVICNNNNDAILFSRNAIPYNRDNINVEYYKHIGIYGFKKEALIQFSKLPQPNIEIAEQLENLRFIYNKIPIRMVETNYTPIGIDTLEDLESARKLILEKK